MKERYDGVAGSGGQTGEFDIRILNHRDLIVHNMQEFLLAGADYLRRSRSEEINARRV